ncbi:MAG: site-2 protease family protein [bacterium]
MKKSIKVFSLFGIPIEINYTWFIIFSLVTFTLARGYFPATNPNLPIVLYWLLAFTSSLLFFTSLLAHELAHSLVAIRNNLPIKGITLFIFGGVAQLEEEPASPAVELRMAIAGPAMSFFLSILFYSLTEFFFYIRLPNYIISITNYLFIINLFVGIFNLVPGFPLDGGRVFRALIWHFSHDLRRATAIASFFGKVIAILLMAMGLINFWSNSFISGLWLIFIGLFLMEAAETSYRQVAMKKFLSGVKVGSLMTKNIVTIPPTITIDKLVEDYFFRFRFSSFPVMEEDQLIGLVTLHDIKELGRETWPNTTAREIMVPLNSNMIISQESELSDALAVMASNGLGRLLVVENNKLVGLLSQRDVIQYFEIKDQVGGNGT